MRDRVRDLVGSVSRHAFRARADLHAVETAIEAALSDLGPAGCNDPVFLARQVRECLVPTEYSIRVVRTETATDAFRLLLGTLLDPPVVPLPLAVDLARAADELVARTDELPRTAADAGSAALVQSSFGRKGRLLATAARILRPESILELGTAFGMSAAYLSRAAPAARVLTLDPSDVHRRIAQGLLDSVGAENVELLELPSQDAVDAVRERLGTVDLLFHDARHSREAYIEDFGLYEPLLRPGAVVLFDDIDWRRPTGPDPQTRAGWTEVAGHDRVGAAVELDGLYGLLQVR